jgi:uncharacterized delta-60 repeat protein
MDRQRLPARTILCSCRLLWLSLAMLALMFTSIPNAIVRAAPGDLDPTFGNAGKVLTQIRGTISGLAIQPDGKLIAAGSVGDAIGSLAVARYDASGNLDPSFGVGGKAQSGLAQALGTAVALQADGKIVVGGSVGSILLHDFALARFNSDGSLDSTFGAGGIVTTDFFGDNDLLRALVIQADGKIVAAGSAYHFPTGYDFALARYNADGSLDASFGPGGRVTTNFADFDDEAFALALQANGKIVAAGYALRLNFQAALIRYNADGTLDLSFGDNGKVMTAFYPTTSSRFSAVALQKDGKIVTAGLTDNGTDNQFALARYADNGELDTSFGLQGKVTTGFPSDIQATSLALQQNGKIVAGGIRLKNAFDASADFILARYTSAGDLDSGFGLNGIIITDFKGGADLAQTLAIQKDGKIIAAGSAWASSTNRSPFCALARYQGDPVFDLCLQDDGSGSLLQINTTTGDYLFSNCAGLTVGGTGSISRRGNQLTLQHNAADRRVVSTVDTSTNKATASVQLFSQGQTFGITDRNITNNTCACR